MARELWDAQVRGENCPLCAEVASEVERNDEGYVVADLWLSRLRLVANQWVPGYSVLVCAQHVCEPYELMGEERSLFFDDLIDVARALQRTFTPIKLNYQILGNAAPHLHCHLIPRYYGEPSPGTPVDPNAGQRLLSPVEAAERIGKIRAAL
jgi:diadenosine tetraphosphate (Ap4A) HIT family hydrolase